MITKDAYFIVKRKDITYGDNILDYTGDVFVSKDKAIEYCNKINQDFTREQGAYFDYIVCDLHIEE